MESTLKGSDYENWVNGFAEYTLRITLLFIVLFKFGNIYVTSNAIILSVQLTGLNYFYNVI